MRKFLLVKPSMCFALMISCLIISFSCNTLKAEEDWNYSITFMKGWLMGSRLIGDTRVGSITADNTKETGILMICEAIEAGIRSIKEPDLIKIEEMITKIINSRISSGQLSECPLTMDELTRIKGNMDGNSGLLSVLKGIYHIRIEYPEELENSKAAEK